VYHPPPPPDVWHNFDWSRMVAVVSIVVAIAIIAHVKMYKN
jgi:hypothetical protein